MGKIVTLYKFGDFYEAMNDDAAIVANICGVVVTKGRANGPFAGVLMCGLPYHSLTARIAELEAAGYRVEVEDGKR